MEATQLLLRRAKNSQATGGATVKKKIHFGVRAEDGRTTNIWTCWTRPNLGDAYLTSDILGKALKFSAHQTGKSHVAFHGGKGEQLFDPTMRPKHRFILKQESEAGPWQHVASVCFPCGSPSNVTREARTDTIWLPEAPSGQATYVELFRFNVDSVVWPRKRSGSNLLAELPLIAPGRLFVVWQHHPFQSPRTTLLLGTAHMFKGVSPGDLREANRAVLFCERDDGVTFLIETGLSM